jgi:hypothetical protein
MALEHVRFARRAWLLFDHHSQNLLHVRRYSAIWYGRVLFYGIRTDLLLRITIRMGGKIRRMPLGARSRRTASVPAHGLRTCASSVPHTYVRAAAEPIDLLDPPGSRMPPEIIPAVALSHSCLAVERELNRVKRFWIREQLGLVFSTSFSCNFPLE